MTDQKSGSPESAPRPRQVTYAMYALAAAALFAILTPLGFSTQKDWVQTQTIKANVSAVSSAVASASKSADKNHKDVSAAVSSASASATKKSPIAKGAKLDDAVSNQTRGIFISSILTVIVLGLLGYGAYRGRYWVRWGVTGFFILGTFTGLGISLFSLVTAVTVKSLPLAIRVPIALSTAAMVVAVVFVNLRPSVAYFALNRPAPRPGQPQRRGLFAPRQPTNRRTSLMKPREPGADRRSQPVDKPNSVERAAAKEGARIKKRASAESVARGAELARNRAKASKSRRTDR